RNSSGLLRKGAFYNPDSNGYGNDAGACAMGRRSYAHRQSPCPTRIRKAWMEKGRNTDFLSQMADPMRDSLFRKFHLICVLLNCFAPNGAETHLSTLNSPVDA